MAKRRPNGDGMVRKLKGKWEGRKNSHPKLGKSLSDSTIVRIHNMLHKAMDDAV